MPFKPTSSFDPDALKVLQNAFDDACRCLTATDGFQADDETRKTLAMRIVDYASRGECGLEDLRAYALAGISNRPDPGKIKGGRPLAPYPREMTCGASE